MKAEDYKRTWAEIDLDAIEHNYHYLRNMNGNAEIAGLIKADAYGLGSVEIARKFERLGARYLCAANLDEAVELRHAGIEMPIMILGFTDPVYTELLIEYAVTQAVPSLEIANAYSKEAQRLNSTLLCHLKLDSGMGRLGFVIHNGDLEKSLVEISTVLRLPGLAFEGVFTHFAVSDVPEEDCIRYTRNQYNCFVDTVGRIEAEWGRKFILKHCSNSGASVYYPEYHLDMIRPGVAALGLEWFRDDLDLKQSLKIKSVIGPIKNFHKGDCVSYGRLWTADKECRIGVLPIGYADGLPRELSGKLSVMTPYGPAPVVGRICMDMMMIDVTNVPEIKTGDEIEIIGGYNSIADLGHRIGGISESITCPITRRIPRFYYEHGKYYARVRYLSDSYASEE